MTLRCSRRSSSAALALILIALSTVVPARAAQTAKQEWIQRSDEHAQVLLRANAAFLPEDASRLGFLGFDENAIDLGLDAELRYAKALEGAIQELEVRRASETDRRVREDLDILIDAARRRHREVTVRYRLLVPFEPAAHIAFEGLRVLLDEQVPPERRTAAVRRLERYAGVAPGSESIFRLATKRFRERTGQPGLLPPFRGEVEKELADTPTYVDGIRALFERGKVAGYERAYEKFREEADAFTEFLRVVVLPTTREDFRLPPELYQLNLDEAGVDMPVDELQARARAAFVDVQTQMQALAPRVARESEWNLTDYRAVIAKLKTRQLDGKKILDHYRRRARDLEEIIRRGAIVTLPERPMEIRLAGDAESAAVPAPHVRWPRLIGNTGESGVFMLPLRIKDAQGRALTFDDFTFESASWTLTAHEGRPGHELQFARMVEDGVSIARAEFAFSSVNVEGWALYAEAETLPYEPLDGQLIALQHRLMRAARAMLDPGLQAGTVTVDDAFRVLKDDVVLSQAMAQQEVDRYRFLAPGQATSYFVGYSRLLEIRAHAQVVLGARFDRKRFNDFVIAQGLIPPRLLARAIDEELIPVERAHPE